MKIKKNGKKTINYHHKSTLYIPVKCTIQQSVNGNVKRKTCDDEKRNKEGQRRRHLYYCASLCVNVRIALDASCCQIVKKMTGEAVFSANS